MMGCLLRARVGLIPLHGGVACCLQYYTAPTERASGPAFELRVRSLLQQRRSDGALDPPPGRPQPRSLLQLPAASHGLSQFLQNAPIPDLPTQAESHHLLSLFLTWLGVNQHFFDSRAFADTMTSLFRSEASRRETMNSVWFIEYLLVMAMGKLMDFDTEVDTPHGLDYFAEAMRLMPPMHLISDHGIIGVEILSLVALNLRWRDRKYEAYFHVRPGLTPISYGDPATTANCFASAIDRHRRTISSDSGICSALRRTGLSSFRASTPNKTMVDGVHA